MFKVIFVVCISLVICSLYHAKDQSFEHVCLETHNELRKLHGVPLMVLDDKIQAWAQTWANHLAKTNSFKHRSKNKYGENLWAKWGGSSITGENAVRSWYREIKNYDWENLKHNGTIGHFTQLIWKNSKRLGCAMARNSAKKKIFVVANYDPHGNMKGAYESNVPRPLK